MQVIFQLIEDLANTDTTTLITGESGTGKGMVAAAVHQLSDRKDEPFVTVNCAAISDELLASELFGHKKGGFTGATNDRIGRFQMAHNGSIFLDEIGDISPRMQAYLLRIIEEGTFERVGESKTTKVDARIIAATNRDLKQKVADKEFREDLYFRLNVLNIKMPCLRDRLEDIPALSDQFLETFNTCLNRKIERLSEQTMEMLQAYHWPGNVRELRNSIERAMVLCQDSVLQPRHFQGEINSNDKILTTSANNLTRKPPAPKTQPEIKKPPKPKADADLIRTTLLESDWNVSEAARRLGISRVHMHRLIKRFDIKRED